MRNMNRFRPPTAETPADEARNAIQGAEQEFERLRSRLESSLEAAIDGLQKHDYAGVASELEGVGKMAAHLATCEEMLDDRRQRLEPPE